MLHAESNVISVSWSHLPFEHDSTDPKFPPPACISLLLLLLTPAAGYISGWMHSTQMSPMLVAHFVSRIEGTVLTVTLGHVHMSSHRPAASL